LKRVKIPLIADEAVRIDNPDAVRGDQLASAWPQKGRGWQRRMSTSPRRFKFQCSVAAAGADL